MATHRSLILYGSPTNDAELAMLRMASDDLWRAGTWAARFLLQAVCTLIGKFAWRSGCRVTDATNSSL